MQTVTVLTDRLPEAIAALEKLLKKAARIGFPGLGYTVGETRAVKTHVNGKEVEVHKTDLALTESVVKVGDHEFLAHIERTDAGVLLDVVPGVTDLDTRFRSATSACQHCNVERSRRHLYAVRETLTGRQKQIGRSCLQLYMGIDPVQVAARFAWLGAFRELGDEERGFGRLAYYEEIRRILSATATVVRLYGWMSKTQAMISEGLTPTSARVALYVGGLQAWMGKYERDEWHAIDAARRPEQDDAEADAVVAFVRDELAGDSEYVHNLKVLFSQDYIADAKRLGIVVSAYAARARARDVELRRAGQKGPGKAHVGAVGDRLRALLVEAEGARQVGEGAFGPTYLYKFRTEAGDVLTWFTGKPGLVAEGERVRLTGTVKALGDYNGAPETQLTRCTLEKLA